MNLKRAAEGFLFHKEADGMPPNTLIDYRRTLREFVAFCSRLRAVNIEEVTTNHVRRHLHHLRTKRELAQDRQEPLGHPLQPLDLGRLRLLHPPRDPWPDTPSQVPTPRDHPSGQR